MRILFVTPYVPSHIRVRPFNLIKSLSAAHDISLVSLLADDYEQAMVKDIEKYCVSVDLIPLPKWQAYVNCLLALPTAVPFRVAYYQSPAFVQRIKEVIQRQSIDVVHGELIKVVPTLKVVLRDANVPVLYDSVDCISWFLEQDMDMSGNLFKKAFVYSELLKMRRYERKFLANFDQLVITTAFDRKQLERNTGQLDNIEIVHNGVDIDYFTPMSVPRVADSLVFCGKLDYFPNAQAILNFCENILPLVWQQRPQVRLTIVGNNPPKAVRALTADKRIEVTGYVQDIRPYLGTASVAVAPIMIAAGMQNKVLEALSMGVPTVTTLRCSLVIGAEDSKHLLVANEPQAYADAIVRLLNNPELAEQIGNAGRQFVEEHYNWPDAADIVDKLYHIVLNSSRQQIHAMNSALLA